MRLDIKQLSRALALLLVVFGGLSQGLFAQFLSWDYSSLITDTVESGAYADMKVGSDGTLHVSYWNRVEDKLIYAWKLHGDDVWHREYVDPTTQNGFRSSVVLDGNGVVHLAYYQQSLGTIAVRYAKRLSPGVFQIESLPDIYGRGYGDYGPTGSITNKERVQHSLELIFDENNKPQVFFFDGWMRLDAFPACDPNSTYGFKLHQGIRVNGQWFVRSMGHLHDLHQSCGSFNQPTQDTLPKGDRYGEYLDALVEPDGRMSVFSMSRFNNQLIRHRNLFPFVDTVWVVGGIDSLERMLSGWTAGWPSFTRFYTIEGVSAKLASDANINVAYTSSIFYGDNFCCTSLTNDLGYTRIRPDGSMYHYLFGTSTNRNYTDIETHGGSDSIFIAYADLSSQYFLLQQSADSGVSWVPDTIMPGIGIGRMQMEIYADTLNVLLFDAANERLVLGRRHVNGGVWQISEVTHSQQRGQSLDATWVVQSGDTIIHTVFNDGYTGELFYAVGTQGTNWAWNRIQIDPSSEDAIAVSIATNNAGNPIIAYNAGLSRDLRIAQYDGTSWQLATVVSAGNPQYTDLAISGQDTVHLLFYDGQQNCLHHGWRHWSDSAWSIEDLTCDTTASGLFPTLALDAAGNPHAAWYDDNNRSLWYGYKDSGSGQWVIDSINGGSSSAVGKFASLLLDGQGLPKVAYLDEQDDVVMLSEQDISGVWSHIRVDSQSISNIGRPIRLGMDGFGKLWVAYNYFTNFEKVKLMHRDGPIWREVGVSTTGRIANSFAFNILGGDLYIIGKKNEIQNSGVALIHAPNGVFVGSPSVKPQINNVRTSCIPNPFSGHALLRIEVEDPISMELSLLDLMGRRIQAVTPLQKFGSGVHEIRLDASSLPQGIYLLELSNPNQRRVEKVVIAR